MKKQIIVISIFFLSIIYSAAGEELFKENKTIETGKYMELTKTAVPVEDGKKYKISFLAGTDSKYSIEENERIRIMNLKDIASRVRILFYDEQGKKNGYDDIYVISNESRNYVLVFYPPAGSKTLKMSLMPAKGAKIFLKEISLSADLGEKESESINPHPTFEYGDLNFYGCASGYGGQFYTRPDGKTVWNTGFLGFSASFPLKGDTYYNIYCRGKKYEGRKSYIFLECYKAGESKPLKEMVVNVSEKGELTKLKTPSSTAYGKIRCYYIILEEFKVTPDK